MTGTHNITLNPVGPIRRFSFIRRKTKGLKTFVKSKLFNLNKRKSLVKVKRLIANPAFQLGVKVGFFRSFGFIAVSSTILGFPVISVAENASNPKEELMALKPYLKSYLNYGSWKAYFRGGCSNSNEYKYFANSLRMKLLSADSLVAPLTVGLAVGVVFGGTIGHLLTLNSTSQLLADCSFALDSKEYQRLFENGEMKKNLFALRKKLNNSSD